jgi:hypothetical protein
MKVTYALILTLILTSALIGCNSNSGSTTGNDNGESVTQTLEMDVGTTNKIQLNNANGNVRLKLRSGSTLKVNVKKIVENGTAELAAELFKEMVVSINTSASTVYVEISGDSQKILDKYNSNANFAINFGLEVPSNLNVFNISTGNGNVTATSLTGAFNLKSGNGNIALKGNMNITGSSTLNAGNGSIAVKLQKFESSQAMNIKTGNGNINFDLASSIQCTLVLKDSTRSDTIDHNGGGVKIYATVGNGIINGI